MSPSPSPIGVAVFPVTPLQQNCTLVWCRKTLKAAIIDPGASVDSLLGAVAKQGLTLDAIWITHGHLDHAGGAAEMQEKTGLDIIGPHPDDQFWIDGIPTQGRMYGLPEARSFTPTRWLAETSFYPDENKYMPVPDPDAEGMQVLEWQMEPGDAVAFNFRTLHGARGNTSHQRRRAFSLRLVGDDARYIQRPGRTSPPFEGHEMQPGQRLREDWFPVLQR